MDIVCFGQQNWEVCWSAKQHLLVRLARRGHRVLYVDPIPDTRHTSPTAKVKALAPAISRLGLREEAGVHIFTPPWAHLLPDRLNRSRRRAVVGRVARKLGLWNPLVLCMWPAQRWLVEGVNPAAVIYFAVDDNSRFGGMDAAFVEHQRREEDALLRECQVALGVSSTLVERFRMIQPHSYLQENGVSLEDFNREAIARAAPHPAIATLPRPRVGFVGQIDDRMDQQLIVALARHLAVSQGCVVLAGRVKEGVDVSTLTAEPNVHFVGFVPYEELAGVYRELDVGLVPYVDSPLTQACNPLKVYEYLAADLPVVATDLAGLNSTRQAISVARDTPGFIAAVDAALAEPARCREARRAVVSTASWDSRAAQLEARMQQALRLSTAA
jgi:glycosyltransferase involved in cell wall biosynthesis